MEELIESAGFRFRAGTSYAVVGLLSPNTPDADIRYFFTLPEI